jgi:hypothetical protein
MMDTIMMDLQLVKHVIQLAANAQVHRSRNVQNVKLLISLMVTRVKLVMLVVMAVLELEKVTV